MIGTYVDVEVGEGVGRGSGGLDFLVRGLGARSSYRTEVDSSLPLPAVELTILPFEVGVLCSGS